MQRLAPFDSTEVFLEKPEHSSFSAHCVTSALLPDRYPRRIEVNRGAYAVQINTLHWLLLTLKKSIRQTGTDSVAIQNSDNEFLIVQEVKDSLHVSKWALEIVTQAVESPSPSCTLFHDVLVPLLCRSAFRGDDEAMIVFLQLLQKNAEFLIQTRMHALTLTTKSAAVRYMLNFERNELGRNARTTVTRTLTHTQVCYGGMYVISSFALATVFQAWCETKLDLYTQLSIPNYKWK